MNLGIKRLTSTYFMERYRKFLQPNGIIPVSYTHLDVYKRQMLKLNSELRAQAREALRGNWVMAAVAALIYSAIVSATSYLPLVGTRCV